MSNSNGGPPLIAGGNGRAARRESVGKAQLGIEQGAWTGIGTLAAVWYGRLVVDAGAAELGAVAAVTVGLLGFLASALRDFWYRRDRSFLPPVTIVFLVLLATLGCASQRGNDPITLERHEFDAEGHLTASTTMRLSHGWYGEGCGVVTGDLAAGTLDALVQQNAATDYIGFRVLPTVLHEVMVPITALTGVPMEIIAVLAGRPAPEPIARSARPGCETVLVNGGEGEGSREDWEGVASANPEKESGGITQETPLMEVPLGEASPAP